jgi:tRNA (guanine-N7-)-methyltransferase
MAARGDRDDSNKPFTAADGRREIRSFVLREGRQTPSQQRAMQELWPRYGLDFRGAPRAFEQVFGRSNPLVVEIGFGNGDALLHAASNDQERDYIGIEVHAPGVGRLLNAIDGAGLANLRVYRHDAVEVLQHEIAIGALDELRIFFPDPWHKKRHHKRRLIGPGFAEVLASRLRIGGLLHLATDWQDYAEQMWDVLDAQPLLRNNDGARGFAQPHAPEEPARRRQTRFESRGLGLGHGVWDLLYTRI